MKKRNFELFINRMLEELGKRIELWLKAKEDGDEKMCERMKFEVEVNLWVLDFVGETLCRGHDLYLIIIEEVKKDFWGIFQGKKRVEVLTEGHIYIEDYKEGYKEKFFEEEGADVIEFDNIILKTIKEKKNGIKTNKDEGNEEDKGVDEDNRSNIGFDDWGDGVDNASV